MFLKENPNRKKNCLKLTIKFKRLMPPTLLSFLTDYFVIFIWLALVIFLARTMITPHGCPTTFTTQKKMKISLKVALSGLRQFLATKSPLKIMKNSFYFTLKALFVLKRFKFLSWLFGHVEKRLD